MELKHNIELKADANNVKPLLQQNPMFKQHLRWAIFDFRISLKDKASFLLFIKKNKKCKKMKFRPKY